MINLKLSDIDWNNDIITFRQSKTGNLVCLPLTPTVGNAIARYIVNERPDVEFSLSKNTCTIYPTF
ncbi:protein of unknown function [Petrocella atlantisensis]|uniref:Uncharacterized protein n=1 Tax=Petrocella atlantisensis TaxID=2173034 RepID=A0A3P7S4K4_9FIRM|nr:protein of unknown function [Petrocella atlantisensis]